MTNKKISFRRNFYWVNEGDLKNYLNMPVDKRRLILVISDNDKLIKKSLIVELGSNPLNENSILFDKYLSKRHNIKKSSYVWPDCMHTIDRWRLTDRNRVKGIPIIKQDIRTQVIQFAKEIINYE
ncbi:MAG: hypothetical protein LBM72_01885 [Mycoplasmataceae bacterium]|jgi:hypothetical protein|nr:hypothetical protein [Mycoplasmataceae bacterium]